MIIVTQRSLLLLTHMSTIFELFPSRANLCKYKPVLVNFAVQSSQNANIKCIPRQNARAWKSCLIFAVFGILLDISNAKLMCPSFFLSTVDFEIVGFLAK